MATFSVINFSESSGVLQTSDSNSNKRESILFYRKNQKIAPAMSGYGNNILVTNEARRKGRVKDVIKVQNPPQPIAVARRNARERNRVKQVNNGFAVLRQHIPTSITSASSDTENGRNKKLSKVETLRMAVEYIRRLEDLLSFSSSSSPEVTDIENDNSMSSYNSYPMISTPSDSINGGFAIKTEMDQKMDRVPRTYQLIHSYEDEENIHPENMNDLDEDILAESHLMDAGIELNGSRDMTFIHSMHSTGSLSPEMNSEHSLSPRTLENDTKPFILNDMNGERYTRFATMEDIGRSSGDTLVTSENGHNLMTVTSWWEHEQLKS